uniref:Uncharacterized protein n=1 Tax=Chenopodium quinoa TaxID=63459 RepID=A0A803MHW9_CHEQI
MGKNKGIDIGGETRKTHAVVRSNIKVWHGGSFKHVNNGEMVYLGGKGRTFKDGLRRIDGDKEVLELGEIAINNRCVELYLKHVDPDPPLTSQGSECSDESDPEYAPEYQEVGEGHEIDGEDDADSRLSDIELEEGVEKEFVEDEFNVGELDESDEELVEARIRVQIVTNKLVQIAHQLQQEAAEGKLGQSSKKPPVNVPIGVGVLFSSDGTPLSQGANTRGGGRRKGRGLGRGSQSTQ